MSAQSPVKFDRSHVSSFGESAIRIETVYYVLDPDYKVYMDIQQAINLEILRRFGAENVKFALPEPHRVSRRTRRKDLAVGRNRARLTDGWC